MLRKEDGIQSAWGRKEMVRSHKRQILEGLGGGRAQLPLKATRKRSPWILFAVRPLWRQGALEETGEHPIY